VSGGGKTFSALLMAAGLAGPNGRVGMIDTENGRGEIYADSPSIRRALPDGYDYIRFDPPYTPERYVEHIMAAEKAGITVGVIDSGTHEWEGIGGVTDMADKAEAKMGRFGKWADPKMRHKRFVYHCLSSPIHLLFCLRAAEKVKMFKRGEAIITSAGQETSDAQIAEKDIAVSLGLQPICEKRFAFEMLLSLVLDERTHCAAAIKVPEPLQPLFAGKRLITKEDGVRIRQWNLEAGNAVGELEQLAKRSRAAAEDGMTAYKAFFAGLTPAQRKALDSVHTENKATAERVDREAAEVPEVAKLPSAIEQVLGTMLRCDGNTYCVTDSEDGYYWQMET
jgi:hypothetical protein